MKRYLMFNQTTLEYFTTLKYVNRKGWSCFIGSQDFQEVDNCVYALRQEGYTSIKSLND